jgi:solute carrier family 25 protein 38
MLIGGCLQVGWGVRGGPCRRCIGEGALTVLACSTHGTHASHAWDAHTRRSNTSRSPHTHTPTRTPQPLDVLRTRMQGDAAKGISRGALQTAAHILSTSGPRGLWIGTAPSVIRLGAGVGLHMVLVDHMVHALTTQLESGAWHLPSLSAAAASASSRVVTSLLMCPVAVAKTRMEYAGPGAISYANTGDALLTIARTEGAGGLFRGLLPTIVTNAPFSGLYYMFYVRLKDRLSGDGRPAVLVNFSSGVVAAVAATLLTQPFDVVRTRLQLSRETGAAGANAASEALRALRGALAQGPASLFVGAAPRVLKRIGQTALVWTLYEELVPRLTPVLVGAHAAVLAAVAERGRRAGAPRE